MRRTYPLYSLFAQDEWEVRPASIFVTAGVKLEHNAFNGADWQPNVRARWQLSPHQTLWTAVARAVRRPTRFEHDLLAGDVGGVPIIQGQDTFDSEVMRGWEAGYRAQPVPIVSLDATAFVQRYDRLRSQEAPLTGFIPLTVGNTLNGRSSGVELSLAVQPAGRLRTQASYTYLRTEITADPGSRDGSGGAQEANDPRHLFTVRAGFDPSSSVEADVWVRGVGALRMPAVPGFAELNARLAWQFRPEVGIALVGQDLLHGHHPEFGPGLPTRLEFQRSVRVMVTFRRP
jgi:iron complex outermembrane receptor protein